VSFSFVNRLIVERVEVDAVNDGHAHGFVISKILKNQIVQIVKKSEYFGIVNNETTSLLNKTNFIQLVKLHSLLRVFLQMVRLENDEAK
jgi:hypothetical protein